MVVLRGVPDLEQNAHFRIERRNAATVEVGPRREREAIDAGWRLRALLQQVAHSAVQAMGKMDEALPDLVCLDVHMPTGNSLSICQMMATEPAAAKGR